MATKTETQMKTLEEITLDGGKHDSPERGMCAMEAVAYLQREPFSDHPACVCPVIASFMRRWNDDLSAADRNRLLKPLLLKCVGTRATAEVESRRAYLAIDWFVRTHTPAWLDLTDSLKPHAEKLRALPPITNLKTLQAAGDALFAARDAASAAGDATWAAAGAAARDATWDAARDAAWAAARAAAWAAARAAAGDAARAALKSTVFALQASAVELFERMVACE